MGPEPATDDDRDRNDQGRYADRIPPEAVLDVFDVRDDQSRPLTAADVVDELEIARRTAHNKLNALVERGVLDTRKVGARGRVWWTPDRDGDLADQSPPAGARESPTENTAVSGEESAAGASTSQPPGEGKPRSTTPHGDESDTFDRDRWRGRLTETVPRSGDVAERRADAILEMYDHLREHGEAENDTLAELVDPDAVEYKNADSIWSNLVKGKETLRALPGVEPPPPSVDEPWRYPPASDDDGESYPTNSDENRKRGVTDSAGEGEGEGDA